MLRSLLPLEFRNRHREAWYARKTALGLVLRKWSRRFWRPPLPSNADGSVNIHLGCGRVDHPRFINVDAIAFPHIHYVGEVTRLPMFKDQSAELIYTCHCLEHISHLDVGKVLIEWRRVLKPGGNLRISIPSFDHILRIYEETGRELEDVLVFLMGAQDYAENLHRNAFTESSLTRLLNDAGFVDVRVWKAGSNEMTTFKDWSAREVVVKGRSYPISLNLEATKPRD